MYEGPDATIVPALIDELILQINDAANINSTIRGAMARNPTMIHLFKDGNGRMARALQTLVLARDGIVALNFAALRSGLVEIP